MSSGAASPTLWEWHAELETEPARRARAGGHAYRVRYRRQGAEAWQGFTLAPAGGNAPTETEVLRAIEAHAEQLPARGR